MFESVENCYAVLLVPFQEEKVDTIIGIVLAKMLAENNNITLEDLKKTRELLIPGVRLAVKHLMLRL